MTSHHEQYTAREASTGSSDRGFGLVMAVALCLLAWWKSEAWGNIFILLCGLAVGFAAVALLSPGLLRPLNVAWSRLGLLLGVVLTPVVLLLIFVVGFLPTGLLLRLSGHRPLRLEFAPGKESYWIDRDPPGPEPRTMIRQF
jgi:hypothetical protein